MEGSREVETLKDSLETLVTPFETERMDSSAYVSPNEAMQDPLDRVPTALRRRRSDNLLPEKSRQEMSLATGRLSAPSDNSSPLSSPTTSAGSDHFRSLTD